MKKFVCLLMLVLAVMIAAPAIAQTGGGAAAGCPETHPRCPQPINWDFPPPPSGQQCFEFVDVLPQWCWGGGSTTNGCPLSHARVWYYEYTEQFGCRVDCEACIPY